MGLGTSTALSLPSPDRSSASYQGWEARAAVSSTPIEAQTQCSCGSVVEHCVSSAKVVGSIPKEHIY